MTPYFFFFDGFGGDAPADDAEYFISGPSISDRYQFSTISVSHGMSRQTGGTPTGSGIGGGSQPT